MRNVKVCQRWTTASRLKTSNSTSCTVPRLRVVITVVSDRLCSVVSSLAASCPTLQLLDLSCVEQVCEQLLEQLGRRLPDSRTLGVYVGGEWQRLRQRLRPAFKGQCHPINNKNKSKQTRSKINTVVQTSFSC